MRDVEVAFGTHQALRGISIDVDSGEFLALLGPSGCGKTTLLRMIAGLLTPDRGHIAIGGQLVVDGARGQSLPPEHRDIGMVFQDYALWPHLSVADNVSFPLEMRRVDRHERRRRVGEVLELVGLGPFAKRSPGTLSGGQQQRVALARALVARPDVVLFDEPLSNLDLDLRETLADEIAMSVRELGLTAVYVTHDQTEAFGVADRVGILVDGHLHQVASPQAVFRDPHDRWVAEFIRAGALLEGRTDQTGAAFQCAEGGAVLPVCSERPAQAGTLLLPRAALATASSDAMTRSGKTELVTAHVTRCRYRGDAYAIGAHLGNVHGPIIEWHALAPAEPGAQVTVSIDGSACRFFPADPPLTEPLAASIHEQPRLRSAAV